MNSEFRDWSDLRVFLAVLREGSSAAAAKGLGMSQPTVARRIDVLEHKLGLTLFERSTRGLEPTADALALRADAEAVEAAALAFGRTAAERRRADAPPIRFTLSHLSLTPELTGLVAEFRAAHPGVAFEFLTTSEPLDLAAGEADVAFRHALRITDDRLIARKLVETPLSYYASEAYIARHGRPDGPEESAGHTFLNNRQAATILGGEEGIRHLLGWRGKIVDAPEQASVEALLHADMGLGLFSPLRGDTLSGAVRLFDAPPEVRSCAWLLTSPAAQKRPEVRAFTAFFGPRYAAIGRARRREVLGD